LAIWTVVAIACAALLTVEGALFLSDRHRRGSGWRLGGSLLLGSLLASGLARRLFDIRAELIHVQCNCEPFQWTDPRITTPLTVGTVLGSLLLVLTAYGSVRALRIVRAPVAPVGERSGARAWSFSWTLLVLAVTADVGAWISANSFTALAESLVASQTPLNPAYVYDGLILGAFQDPSASPFCGALLLIVPLGLMLVVLRRSSRAFPALAERWLSVATVAIVLAAFFAAVDEELDNFPMSEFWWRLRMTAWLLAGCAFVLAMVYVVPEDTQRGSGMQR
jgi:hypothetical protein